jgi:2-polyprenyl-3-methyl-5-hydroxy-6-metoxy-1,4-benzoquinol methylase
MFNDVWESSKEISWLDVGAGYGEVIEAVSSLATSSSKIVGIEPMKPKADHAKSRGLNVQEGYLSDINEKFQFLSLINVYSHIPDFRAFLAEIKRVLTTDGEIFIETGNIADLISPQEVPTELDLPDHLVFAGEKHIVGYLQDAGFTVIYIKRRRKDGLVNFAKNIVKKILGRNVTLSLPYLSSYRTLLIRAKLF